MVTMASVKTRAKKGGKAAAAAAKTMGTKAAKTAAAATDSMLVRIGDAAKKRQRARKAKSALKTAGKAVLLLGAGVATAFAGKKALARRNGKARKRR